MRTAGIMDEDETRAGRRRRAVRGGFLLLLKNVKETNRSNVSESENRRMMRKRRELNGWPQRGKIKVVFTPVRRIEAFILRVCRTTCPRRDKCAKEAPASLFFLRNCEMPIFVDTRV